MIHYQFYSDCPKVGVLEKDMNYQLVEIQLEDFRTKQVLHILYHVLGKYHEHQRPDRDQHIRIVWENIKRGDCLLQLNSCLCASYTYICINTSTCIHFRCFFQCLSVCLKVQKPFYLCLYSLLFMILFCMCLFWVV